MGNLLSGLLIFSNSMLFNEVSIPRRLNMIAKSRVSREKIKPTVSGLFRSIKADLWSFSSHYEMVEQFLRQFPGRTGVYLRYKILTRYFRRAGSDIVIRLGIRIQDPDQLTIGSNVGIGLDCTMQCGGGLFIGDDVLFGAGVKIWTVNHLFADIGRPISHQGLEYKSVEIGSDCWLCSDTFIKPGTLLPKGCVVFPKSVVSKMPIPPYSVLSGNPAKVLGSRSKLGKFMEWVRDSGGPELDESKKE
jgi:acetyltransferase-like isoleucine patch superfamily enzyme